MEINAKSQITSHLSKALMKKQGITSASEDVENGEP